MQRSIYDINNQEFRYPTPWWAWVVVLFIAPLSLFVAGAWCLHKPDTQQVSK
jgi:hypothetical protein